MKKLWQLCACAAGVLAGLWLTARILLPVGLPFLLGLGLARLARPLAARLRRLPRGLAAFLSVTAVCLAAGAVLTGLGWALWQGCAALCARLPISSRAMRRGSAPLRRAMCRRNGGRAAGSSLCVCALPCGAMSSRRGSSCS